MEADYLKNLCKEDTFSVQITPIYNEDEILTVPLRTSRVRNCKFTVHGDPAQDTEFYWLVHASRGPINPEPYKSEVNVRGFGPYCWV